MSTEPGNLLARLGHLRDALSPDATYTGLGRARILQDAVDEIERLRTDVYRLEEDCAAHLDVEANLRSEIDRLRDDLRLAEDRCETWKAQAARDQQECRVLKAQIQGAHCTAVNRADPVEARSYPVPQLVMFLRELVKRADTEGFVTPGKWRAEELSQSADRMQEMYESYLAECPHELEAERLRAIEARLKRVVALERYSLQHVPQPNALLSWIMSGGENQQ
ncbi:MAG: hypothetical protein ACYCUI_07195 [Vulcanimicrobiaceae bacterium]